MITGICFTSFNHFLESILGGSKKQRVIRISLDTKVGSADPASALVLPEELEEVVHVEAVGKTRQNCALADTIGHTE